MDFDTWKKQVWEPYSKETSVSEGQLNTLDLFIMWSKGYINGTQQHSDWYKETQ